MFQKQCWPKACEVLPSKTIKQSLASSLSRPNDEENITVGCSAEGRVRSSQAEYGFKGCPGSETGRSCHLRHGTAGAGPCGHPPSLHGSGGLLQARSHLTLWLEWSVAGRGVCRTGLLCEFLPEGSQFAHTQAGLQPELKQSKWRWLERSPWKWWIFPTVLSPGDLSWFWLE